MRKSNWPWCAREGVFRQEHMRSRRLVEDSGDGMRQSVSVGANQNYAHRQRSFLGRLRVSGCQAAASAVHRLFWADQDALGVSTAFRPPVLGPARAPRQRFLISWPRSAARIIGCSLPSSSRRITEIQPHQASLDCSAFRFDSADHRTAPSRDPGRLHRTLGSTA